MKGTKLRGQYTWLSAASCKPKILCFAITEVFTVVTFSFLSDNVTLFAFSKQGDNAEIVNIT